MSDFVYDFVKESAIKDFITNELRLRSANDAVNFLGNEINEMVVEILKRSAEIVKKEDRKTILKRDVETAIHIEIAQTDLDSMEILNQLLNESPADLGVISSGIDQFIEERETQ
jgi:histone H3/H4